MIDHPQTSSLTGVEPRADTGHLGTSSVYTADDMNPVIGRLRAAQLAWQQRPYRERLHCIGQIAGLLADQVQRIAQAVHRPAASMGDILASEVLPLAEACRYTARRGGEILKPRPLRRRDTAWWMGSISVTEHREACGVVLVIGPSNYPLFLPGVQLIQGLAAGNAVVVKPAPGCELAVRALVDVCIQAGVPAELMVQLDSDPGAATACIAAGVDKVLFTGSLHAGRQVAALCAQYMTPMAMELSGNDPVLVTDEADLSRVAQCVAYGLVMNGGQTCIAPRRLLATQNTLDRLVPLLAERLKSVSPQSISERGLRFARTLVEQALGEGAELACGSAGDFDDSARVMPLVLSKVNGQMSVANSDIFAPLLSLIAVRDMDDAVRQASNCPYALGAAVFGQPDQVQAIVAGLSAGCITINDVLVPTADPRVSFGGRKASGFGLTRGLEGLRELTQLKVVCARRGRWLPHLTTQPAQLVGLLTGIMQMRHGRTWSQRLSGIKSLMKVGKQK